MPDYVAPPFQIPAALLSDLEKLGAILDLGAEVHQLGLQMIKKANLARAGKPFDSDYSVVAYMIFSKAFMTFQAVRNLCLTGCGPDALALGASLFENLVDLSYIRQAPKLRARRYVQYEQVDKYFQAHKVLGRKRLPKGVRQRYRKYVKHLLPQVSKLLRLFPKQRSGWAGKNLRERAKAVKLDLDYDELYYVLCGLKHTLPAGAVGYVFETESGAVDVLQGPSMKGVYFAAFHSTLFFLGIAELFHLAFDLKSEVQLKSMPKALVEAAENVHKSHPELCD